MKPLLVDKCVAKLGDRKVLFLSEGRGNLVNKHIIAIIIVPALHAASCEEMQPQFSLLRDMSHFAGLPLERHSNNRPVPKGVSFGTMLVQKILSRFKMHFSNFLEHN